MPIRKVNRAMWRVISWYSIYRLNSKWKIHPVNRTTAKCIISFIFLEILAWSVSTWRQGGHISVPKHGLLSSYIVFYAAVPFLLIPPRLVSKLVWKLAEEIGLQIGIKALSFLGSPANGKESNAKYPRFYTDRNLTETIYHWSVILRRINVVSTLTVHNVKVL